MPKYHGFTLIELLITISIIATLSAIGFVSYSIVMKQGRDAKRQSDLRSIQSALEQYYADQFSYPVAPLPASGNPLESLDNSKTYLNQMPTDPNPSNSYCYAQAGNSYELCAKLEVVPSPPQSCSNPCNGYNFKLTPP
ncbi:type II secretion system GspH family protein [Patescibacteria group bacterium]|nr:type II secretion system GspH family protein [Patescibacteria group bacterium]